MPDRAKPFVLAVLLVVLAAGCAKAPPPNPYPQELVDNFMTGCRQRSSASICECALDRIRRRWTADEFQKLDQTLGDGDAAAAQIAETVAACAGR
jgi:hypothetical protein